MRDKSSLAGALATAGIELWAAHKCWTQACAEMTIDSAAEWYDLMPVDFASPRSGRTEIFVSFEAPINGFARTSISDAETGRT
jgi:hypothetical protein